MALRLISSGSSSSSFSASGCSFTVHSWRVAIFFENLLDWDGFAAFPDALHAYLVITFVFRQKLRIDHQNSCFFALQLSHRPGSSLPESLPEIFLTVRFQCKLFRTQKYNQN